MTNDPLAAAIQELKQVVEKLRDDLVRKDVYVEARRSDDRRMNEIEKDLEIQAGFRRQVMGGVIVGILLMLAQVVVTLTMLRGGS